MILAFSVNDGLACQSDKPLIMKHFLHGHSIGCDVVPRLAKSVSNTVNLYVKRKRFINDKNIRG